MTFKNLFTFLGAFKHSDTTSIILIRINGSNMQSKTILLEKEQKRFKRSSKWTFLIKSQHHLGAIESLNIWIIPSGSKSSWYCERIEIRDMLKLEQYNFIVCKWISLTREDGKIYCTVQLASKADLEQDQSKSKRNFLKTLHESFSTCSIFARHSRLTLNWRQRLTITFVWISISTFFSILLFGQTELENIEDEHEEFSKFSFNQKVFLVALQIQVIIWPLFRILEYFYNKRKKSFTNDFEVIHRE